MIYRMVRIEPPQPLDQAERVSWSEAFRTATELLSGVQVSAETLDDLTKETTEITKKAKPKPFWTQDFTKHGGERGRRSKQNKFGRTRGGS